MECVYTYTKESDSEDKTNDIPSLCDFSVDIRLRVLNTSEETHQEAKHLPSQVYCIIRYHKANALDTLYHYGKRMRWGDEQTIGTKVQL